ncbi:MAG: ABC transporter permease [Synergistaceae bacterium]|jgi:ABC-2 type transport system permease protein|nr:ABC transporter permease [Synergistaceae bacterium]
MFSAFHRTAALAAKEFYVVLMDRRCRAQVFVAPFVMLAVFSFAVTMEVKNAALAVLNEDTGDLGRQFAAAFSSGPAFIRERAFEVSGARELDAAIETQKALMALHIPGDFSARLTGGQSVAVQVVLDGRKTNAAQIAGSYAAEIARSFALSLAAREPILDVRTRLLYNPNQMYLWFTLPMLLVILTQMIALIVSGLSVARERELGTFEQLLVSPFSSTEIVAGKTVPAVLLAFCEGALIHCVALWLFGVPFAGSLPLLAASFGLFILSVTGMGLFISSLCETQQQAFLGCFMYIVPSVLLSGFATPIENMPEMLQTLTLLNPMRHIVTVALGIYLKGTPFSDILPELLWLAGIASATLSLAGRFFAGRHLR